jgi:uroporphyrinogen-III synthase
MTSVPAAPLSGRCILVTRPQAQAQALARLIGEAGGTAACVPAIEIRELGDLGPLRQVADRLEGYDFAIFVSRNAVKKAMQVISASRPGKPWPARVRVATVGQGSREELREHGIGEVLAPEGRADSEALLALPALQDVQGRRVALFRGDGGRALLGEELERRGATVEYVPCYRRVRPEAGPLSAIWARGVDAVTVSSAEGLSNFIDMLGADAKAQLSRTALFVPHARVAQAAQLAGMQRVIVAGPRDAEMAAALVAYFSAAR